jgi:putative acetyltransferase
MSYVIREFRESDGMQIATLFYETVHTVNAQDYTEEQVNAWAPRLSGSEADKRVKRFVQSLRQHISYVADKNGIVIGFADISQDGYIDYMYVHKDYQRQGVASALLRTLEAAVIPFGVQRVWANVSITARPFFEHYGYAAVQSQIVQLGGVYLSNFRMEKHSSDFDGRCI